MLAALLVVLLIAAVVIGIQAWRTGGLTPRPVPAGKIPTITAYQAMVSADEQQFLSTNSFTCANFDDATCLPNVAIADGKTQKWLDDLNRWQPPPRFVALSAVMRAHLAIVLSADVDFVAAFTAKVANGKAKAASDVIVNEMVVLERLAGDAAASSQGSVAVYTADVGFERQIMLRCALCQPLLSHVTVYCQGDQSAACIDQIAAIRLQLETFIEDLVKVSAPDSLANKDASLQADLVNAYAASKAALDALSAGDQTGFQTRVAVLGQDLSRIDADATSIAGPY
jgi:hypothetical protein